jgi:multidrug efflux pump subunit AcrA (membrane-fusion protein)
MFARIRVPSVDQTKAMLVPEAAVGTDQLGRYVLLANDKNVVERRGIETGPAVGAMRVVEKGLNGDEWVIVNGLLQAMPGREVNPSREQKPEAASSPQTSTGS